MFISQPALSKQIASLERVLGASLFVRRPDGVTLTEAGSALLPYAQRMVELDREAAGAVMRAARMAQKLTLGFWVAPANEVLHATVEAVSTRHPDVRIRLRRADWSEPGAGVASGAADVALVHTPHGVGAVGFRSHRFPAEGLVVAFPRGHRLAGRASVAAADLSEETHLVLPAAAGQLGRARLLVGGRTDRVEEVTTIDETIASVANGLGVCVLTAAVFAAHPDPAVSTVPVTDMDPADLHVVWRAEDERRPEVTTLVQALVTAYEVWVADPAGGPPDRS